jgi:hypothetical protein
MYTRAEAKVLEKADKEVSNASILEIVWDVYKKESIFR